jgi:hypothetical protein
MSAVQQQGEAPASNHFLAYLPPGLANKKLLTKLQIAKRNRVRFPFLYVFTDLSSKESHKNS